MQNCQSLCQTAPILLLVLLTTEILTCWILISPNLSHGLSSFHNIPYVPIFSRYFHIFSIYVPTYFSISPLVSQVSQVSPPTWWRVWRGPKILWLHPRSGGPRLCHPKMMFLIFVWFIWWFIYMIYMIYMIYLCFWWRIIVGFCD